MDREGVDIQVLSPIPVTFSYWAPPEQAEMMAKIQNDFIAETVNEYPDRFAGLGTVPMQDSETAIREMDRCMNELGLHGIEIGTNINGQNLDHPDFLPFLRWRKSGKCRFLFIRGKRSGKSVCQTITLCTR